MIGRLRSLQTRRGELVQRSSRLRASIGERLAPVARRLNAADRLIGRMQAHPVITGVALAALLLIGRQTLLRWLLKVAPLYALLRRS